MTEPAKLTDALGPGKTVVAGTARTHPVPCGQPLSDMVFKRMLDDAIAHAMTGPGGQQGNDSDSSATDSHPDAGSSDKPLPGPAIAKPKTALPAAS